MENRIKVLYITGWGRSGSTIISNILGQVSGFFSVGEIRFIWERNVIENTYCGCGSLFGDCEVWKDILDIGFGGIDQIDSARMARLCEQETRTRRLIGLAISRGKPRNSIALQEYLENLKRLYTAIQSSTGCRVIVDSSKYPSYGYLLGMIPEIDLSVLHLVRDSRAVSFSWRKKKLQKNQSGSDYMIQINPFMSSVIWDIWNQSAEIFWKNTEKYIFMTYEEFIAAPQKSIHEILEMLGEDTDLTPLIQDNRIVINPQHTLSGNPVRFQTGPVELKVDNAWKHQSDSVDKYLTTFLTWPLLLKYGYRL